MLLFECVVHGVLLFVIVGVLRCYVAKCLCCWRAGVCMLRDVCDMRLLDAVHRSFASCAWSRDAMLLLNNWVVYVIRVDVGHVDCTCVCVCCAGVL